jgi:hypothetical protein
MGASIGTAIKAAWQLGPLALGHYAWYAFKLRSGLLRAQTQPGDKAGPAYALRSLVEPASPNSIRNLLGGKEKKIYREAEEIMEGKVRLFGGEPRPLKLKFSQPLSHWIAYAKALPDGSDIKPVWEAGRFGWATLLARAYWLSGKERYAESFWKLSELFLRANPLNLGPQWSSAQEVALRMIALCFAYSLVAEAQATTVERKELLSRSLAQHAERILPTLGYAQAQNNNHLLSEALGLWTAAEALPTHPRAAAWRRTGRRLFDEGVRDQVTADGAYAQHSANYQRLMLQLGTWASLLAAASGEPLSAATRQKLQAACEWLLTLVDETSGRAPNLGPNDGAYILPLSSQPFNDFRPALQAAAAAFGVAGLKAGEWDELRLWLGLQSQPASKKSRSRGPLRLEAGDSWAYLRAARFTSRPGHADQLHLDLWWQGMNIAQDAGTFAYNAAEPWANALASTAVHNTLMLDEREQMTRTGRFLWLDWAQARVLTRDPGPTRATAEHDGYRRLGLTHRRHVEAGRQEWLVRDQVLGDVSGHLGRLHWLLPDWPWRIQGDTLSLLSPRGRVRVQVRGHSLSLVRAGRRIAGRARPLPTHGWVSPTYGVKQPALALIVDVRDEQLKDIVTLFQFPKAK